MAAVDFHMLEWDDTELIRAYNKGLKAMQGSRNDNEHSSQTEERKMRKWDVGDFCKARFSGDQSYYEAKIINKYGDFCTVEFEGYGGIDDVHVCELEESNGMEARKKQIQASISNSMENNGSTSESEPGEDTTGGTVAGCSSFRKKKRNVNKPANIAALNTEATFHQRHAASPSPAPSPSFYMHPPRVSTDRPNMATPATMPQYQVPPAPPMPQIPSQANDPSISSMMSAWYMAGYYTGLNSARKENHECQRCCNCSNDCSRN